MRQLGSRTRGVLVTLFMGAVVLLWSAVSFAGTPTLGPDCGASASIAGSDSAGKVTLGQGAASSCTVTFSVPYTNAPACTASNETNGGGYSVALGTKTTPAGVVLGGSQPWADGDVISYVCVEY